MKFGSKVTELSTFEVKSPTMKREMFHKAKKKKIKSGKMRGIELQPRTQNST